MPILSKRRRHKIMARVLRSLMRRRMPPSFRFRDNFQSIRVPPMYQHVMPTQEKIESKFSELEAKEEAVDAKESAATVVISREDVAMTSNLEVGTANLFVDTITGRVGIGKTNPSSTLDIVGDVTITGTVNGRDLDADINKVNTILDSQKVKYQNPYYEIDINNPATTTGTSWVTDLDTNNWGVPKFNSAYNQFRHGDAPDVLEYTIPHGMKSHICHTFNGIVVVT